MDSKTNATRSAPLRIINGKRIKMNTTTGKTTIKLKGVKLNTMLPPAALLAANLVPPEPQPAGNPVIELEIEGSPLVVRCVLNGKSVRRAVKTIAELGPDGVNVLLQGNLKPATKEGGPYELDAAGLAVSPKTPKPTEEGSTSVK